MANDDSSPSSDSGPAGKRTLKSQPGDEPSRGHSDSRRGASDWSLRSDIFRYEWGRSAEREQFKRFARLTALVSGALVLTLALAVTIYNYAVYYQDCVLRIGVTESGLRPICGAARLLTEALFRGFAIYGALALLVALLANAYILLFRRLELRRQLRGRLIVEAAQEALQSVEESVFSKISSSASELELSSLWDATHKRLNLYHSIATEQAQISFRRANAAMIIGFVIVGLSIPIALISNGIATSISISLLGAIAAALSAFIGQTFIRSQETAADHLRAYFLQPLEFSRYLVAERLLNTLGEERKSEGILLIVEGIARFSSTKGDDKSGLNPPTG